MHRLAKASAVALVMVLAAPLTFAQSKPAQAPATKAAAPTAAPAPAAAAPAKFAKIYKGVATIDVVRGNPKKVGDEMVTVMKVRNTSAGALAGFKIEEYWYDKSAKPKIVTGDTQQYKKPFPAGEIIELTMKSPLKPGVELYQSQYKFFHVNGDVKPTQVKKLP